MILFFGFAAQIGKVPKHLQGSLALNRLPCHMAVWLWWFSYNWFILDYDDILGSPLTKWLSWVLDYWICSSIKPKVFFLVFSFSLFFLPLVFLYLTLACRGKMLCNGHVFWVTLLWGWQKAIVLTIIKLQSSI